MRLENKFIFFAGRRESARLPRYVFVRSTRFAASMSKRILLSTFIFIIVIGFFIGAHIVFGADDAVTVRGGLAESSSISGLTPSGDQTLSEYVGSVINVVLSFLGVAFLILALYAGILWMTAAGDQTVAQKAKTILVDAAVGLFVILISYQVVTLVIKSIQLQGTPGELQGSPTQVNPGAPPEPFAPSQQFGF